MLLAILLTAAIHFCYNRCCGSGPVILKVKKIKILEMKNTTSGMRILVKNTTSEIFLCCRNIAP